MFHSITSFSSVLHLSVRYRTRHRTARVRRFPYWLPGKVRTLCLSVQTLGYERYHVLGWSDQFPLWPWPYACRFRRWAMSVITCWAGVTAVTRLLFWRPSGQRTSPNWSSGGPTLTSATMTRNYIKVSSDVPLRLLIPSVITWSKSLKLIWRCIKMWCARFPGSEWWMIFLATGNMSEHLSAGSWQCIVMVWC